jgi:prepilin-type N-terminal cleavage/methylation domain-containing protein
MITKFLAKKSNKKGFTLVELLLVLAIISILSGTILITVSSHKKRAEEAKMQAQLAGAISDVVLCRSDEGNVNEPNGTAGGENICSLGGAYGQWPATAVTTGFGNYVSDATFEDGAWFVYTDDGTARICCNSGSNQCHHLNAGTACTAIAP